MLELNSSKIFHTWVHIIINRKILPVEEFSNKKVIKSLNTLLVGWWAWASQTLIYSKIKVQLHSAAGMSRIRIFTRIPTQTTTTTIIISRKRSQSMRVCTIRWNTAVAQHNSSFNHNRSIIYLGCPSRNSTDQCLHLRISLSKMIVAVDACYRMGKNSKRKASDQEEWVLLLVHKHCIHRFKWLTNIPKGFLEKKMEPVNMEQIETNIKVLPQLRFLQGS